MISQTRRWLNNQSAHLPDRKQLVFFSHSTLQFLTGSPFFFYSNNKLIMFQKRTSHYIKNKWKKKIDLNLEPSLGPLWGNSVSPGGFYGCQLLYSLYGYYWKNHLLTTSFLFVALGIGTPFLCHWYRGIGRPTAPHSSCRFSPTCSRCNLGWITSFSRPPADW